MNLEKSKQSNLPKFKIIHLEHGQAMFFTLPEGSRYSVEDVRDRQKGKKWVLVRVT